MSHSNKRLPLALGIISLVVVAAGATYMLSSRSETMLQDMSQDVPLNDGADSVTSTQSPTSTQGQGTSATSGQTDAATSDNDSVTERLESSQLTGETEFSRAAYFNPVDWGSGNASLTQKEPQTLQFKPACQSHPRSGDTSAHPAVWAEAFTQTDSTSRWPQSTTHVIDWNQFWQMGDRGIQISIRWNFELPARYNVVGYSFALNNPDGFGAALWPDKPEMSWDEAKAFVVEWEKKTLENGGKPGTRTMSVAEKPFNPADVSTEEIERAEYHNSRVRAVQTGKMICNSSPAQQELLSCSCWF